MPAPLEARFALSALPKRLRPRATVYVLDPARGYVLERKGTNGQSCLVKRMEWQAADYRNDLFAPICFDEAGTTHQMRVILDAAALRARGIGPELTREQIWEGFFSGDYTAPDRPGIAYMTAPVTRTYSSPDPGADSPVVTVSAPRVLYYAPNVPAGRGNDRACPPGAPYPYVLDAGPHGYFVQRLGAQESARIVADEASLLADLCAYRRELCLPAAPHSRDQGRSHEY